MYVEGYERAIQLLRDTSSEYGFYASLKEKDNYKRIFARDGVISGIASLLSGEEDLVDLFRKTLDTLKKYQGRQGEIPSNVDPLNGDVSYGILSGKVDASLWYVIGCVKYYEHTKDEQFLLDHYKSISKTIDLLECWEFNRKDFIFVPESGDWADEMPRRGYLLYDQILYYLALDQYVKIAEDPQYWEEKRKRLREKIRVNFWPQEEVSDEFIYHEITHKRLKKLPYWLESFNATSERFDAFANILAITSGISNAEQNKSIVEYISKISADGMIPAFYPTIEEGSAEWDQLSSGYSFSFKNNPHSLQNGGLWPMINGFYVFALSRIGEKEKAKHYLDKITEANKMNDWAFYEYIHGKENTTGGVPYMAWSAAGQIIAYKSYEAIC